MCLFLTYPCLLVLRFGGLALPIAIGRLEHRELTYKVGVHFLFNGGLAQLARAPALHAGGHRFDSDILHQKRTISNER